jgi:DNA mismatch repair ATPase MutS
MTSFIICFPLFLQNYVKPNFVTENEASQIHIKNGRHPVSSRSLPILFLNFKIKRLELVAL